MNNVQTILLEFSDLLGEIALLMTIAGVALIIYIIVNRDR